MPGQGLYAIYHAAHGEARTAIVYVHPFAEEMNKSRRMAALGARALADAGHAVLQVDLSGCGDSAGDFDAASWPQWQADLAAAAAWLQQRVAAPLCWWGLRAGCLLAAQAAAQLATPRLLLWQPVASGKLVLQQFLRMKLAAGFASAAPKVSSDEWRAQLAAGRTVEVAGYGLTAAVADGLGAAGFDAPTPAGRVDWIDVANDAGMAATPASLAAQVAWQRGGWDVRARVAVGPAFWQSVEIEVAPQLLTATLQALEAQP